MVLWDNRITAHVRIALIPTSYENADGANSLPSLTSTGPASGVTVPASRLKRSVPSPQTLTSSCELAVRKTSEGKAVLYQLINGVYFGIVYVMYRNAVEGISVHIGAHVLPDVAERS